MPVDGQLMNEVEGMEEKKPESSEKEISENEVYSIEMNPDRSGSAAD